MSGVETIHKQANPPVCYECDKQLACGGWQYALVEIRADEHTYRVPTHKQCAKREGHKVVAEYVGRAPKAAKKAQGDGR